MKVEEYKKIDEALHKIAMRLSSIPCLPSNYQSEKQRFFSQRNYNPIFKYPDTKENLQNIKQVLLELEIGDDNIGVIFKKKRDELVQIIDLMQAIGERRFTNYSIRLYGIPEQNLVSLAWKLIDIHDTPDNIFLSSKQVVTRLQYAITRYGFDWKIEEKDMVSKACVNPNTRTLYIKKDTFFTNKFVNRIIVHEIGTHILRFENGTNQPYKIFSLGLTNYLPTEEGLAVVNEELNNCLTRSTLKTYAARVIAVHKGLRCNFRETYNYIVPYVGKENAFEITLRVKRGLGNTLWAGAFTKDYLYLKGYLDVKKFLMYEGDMRKLYYGKVALGDIKTVEKMPGLINPMFFSTMKYYVDYIKYRKPRLK